MTLLELYEQCQLGKLGMFPKYDGVFKWNFGTNSLDYLNSNQEQFPASTLKDWESIKDSSEFYYII